MTVIDTLLAERKEVIWEIFHSLPYRENERLRDDRENEEARQRNQYRLREENIDLWHRGE